MIGNSKLSPTVRESNKDISNTFKDSYVFEFLNLPDPHSESDLQRGLVRQMKNFIFGNDGRKRLQGRNGADIRESGAIIGRCIVIGNPSARGF